MMNEQKQVGGSGKRAEVRGITQRPAVMRQNEEGLGVAKAVTYMCSDVTRMPKGRTRSREVPTRCNDRKRGRDKFLGTDMTRHHFPPPSLL